MDTYVKGKLLTGLFNVILYGILGLVGIIASVLVLKYISFPAAEWLVTNFF
jgi:hypothetical protein